MPDGAMTTMQPLLPAQVVLWTQDRLLGDGRASLRGDMIRICGALDPVRFEAALGRAVAEADGLRLRVAMRDRRPVLEVVALEGVALERIDLRGGPAPWEAALAWFDAQCDRPIAAEAAVPFRFALLRVAAEEHLWVRFVSQVAVDWQGRQALTRRVRAHLAAGESPPPRPPGWQDCAAPFRAAAHGRRYQAGAAHWQARLAQMPPVLWPAAGAAPGRLVRADARRVDLAALRALSGDGSPARWVLAAVGRALCRQFGRPAVGIGVPVDMRGGARFADTIGSFAVTLPVAVVERGAGLAAQVREIGAGLGEDYRHARFPLHALSGGAAVDVVCNYLPQAATGDWVEVARHHGPSAPLIVTASEVGGELEVALDFDAAVLDPGAADAILHATLAGLVPEAPAGGEAARREPAGGAAADGVSALAGGLGLAPGVVAAGLAGIAAARVLDRLDGPRREGAVTLRCVGVPGAAGGGVVLRLPAAMALGVAIPAVAGWLGESAEGGAAEVTLSWRDGAAGLEFGHDVPEAARQAIGAAFRCLCDDGAAMLAAPLSGLRIMPAAAALGLLAMGRGLATGRGPAMALAADATLPALFAAQVARTPDAPAVRDGAGTLGYRALAARVGAVATALDAAGVGPGCVVGVLLARDAGMVAALLAIQHLGAGFLPLDAGFPEERQHFMLRDAGAMLLVADRPVVAPVPVLRLDGALAGGPMGGQVGGPVPAMRAVPGGVAYVIYTSGSSGQPKGVMVGQRSLANLALAGAALLGPAACGGVLFATALVFDVAMFELFSPLVSGGQVLVVEGLSALRGSPLAGAVRTVSGSPTVLDAVVRGIGLPAGVTTIVAGGEALSRDLADRLLAARPGVRVVNAYGPTEATVYASAAEIGAERAAPTIGRALANMALHVLDRQGGLLPMGVEGELCLGGVGVAMGYRNRDALTAARFVVDPFGGGRLYRTGDRARWRADGAMEFLGRRDGQVKLHGVRIEPGEVEAALRRVPGVAAAAVGVHGAGADQRLVAWVVAEGATPAGLRRALAGMLPRAMIPAGFVFLDRLPVTTSGKLDRAALPAPVVSAASGRPPATPRQREIHALWQAVLEQAAIREGAFGIDETLDELGVDSLGAVLVCAEVEAVYGRVVPPERIAAGLTVAGLAAFVDGVEQEDGLRLLADGQLVAAERDGDLYRFRVVLPVRDVRLVSRAAVPGELGTAADDRLLGVQLAGLVWEQGGRRMDVALDEPFLGEGFHQYEASGRRWTDGQACLAADRVPDWQGEAVLKVRAWDWLRGRVVPAVAAAHGWLARFDSLGSSCEFGFVQRTLGVRQPLSLLRWAATDHRRVMAGLTDGFAALGDPSQVAVRPSSPDYRLATPYAVLHTFQSMTASGPDREAVMHRRGMAALAALRRQLLADLGDPGRVFVFTSAAADFGIGEMRALKAAMGRHGEATLLCVTLAEAGAGPGAGEVRVLGPGLYWGRVSRFAGEAGPIGEWLAVCRRTLVLDGDPGQRWGVKRSKGG